MNTQQLFRRSRHQLALWYASVMAAILSLSGFVMYRAALESKWQALEREIESIAGTLHDSVEPLLPQSQAPTTALRRIFPELCVTGQSCNPPPASLIQRHTIGISDRSTYYFRLYDIQGRLLAFSPNHPVALADRLSPDQIAVDPWHTKTNATGDRYRQFTILLHSSAVQHKLRDGHDHSHSWGYLQVGRTLAGFDTERQRLLWISALGLPIGLGLIALSSWWLAGLAMQPIYRSYQQQQQFTANAAHELRSPLSGLLATIAAILRLAPADDRSRTAMLETIEKQGLRLSQLINDLLLLSRLEQRELNHDALSDPQPCCLNDLLQDLVEEFAELAVAAHIQMRSQMPSNLIYIVGQEQQLYRVVSNLLTNAIHYTSAQGQIQITLSSHNRTAQICIQDSGSGIPAAAQTRIFERFYRVNPDRSRQTGGTGLGLAIADAIVRQHNGRITVQSQIGQGSQFCVWLPIATVSPPATLNRTR